MANVSIDDIFSVAEELSFTASESDCTPENELALVRAAAVLEGQEGADRSRSSIGFNDELNYYEFVGAGSSTFMPIWLSQKTQMECILRAKRPNAVLVGGFVAGPLSVASAVGATEIDVINSVHLDYYERFYPGSKPDYNTVTFQDIEQNIFPRTYDAVVVLASHVAHNPEILENIYGSLNSQGVIFLVASHDQGNLYKFKETHPYYSMYVSASNWEGAHVYQIPAGLGSTVITKE